VQGSIAEKFPQMDVAIAKIIEGCLEHLPDNRPKMREVAEILAHNLVKDRHRAQIIKDGELFELNATNRKVNIRSHVGAITIQYDGINFIISDISGSVFINNKKVTGGSSMLSACVITIGEGNLRAFLTFNISHPELAA